MATSLIKLHHAALIFEVNADLLFGKLKFVSTQGSICKVIFINNLTEMDEQLRVTLQTRKVPVFYILTDRCRFERNVLLHYHKFDMDYTLSLGYTTSTRKLRYKLLDTWYRESRALRDGNIPFDWGTITEEDWELDITLSSVFTLKYLCALAVAKKETTWPTISDMDYTDKVDISDNLELLEGCNIFDDI